jgi:hypothetical protein
MEWFGFWLMLGLIFAASEIKDGMEEIAERAENAATRLAEAVENCWGKDEPDDADE